jgi:hypothetical protein
MSALGRKWTLGVSGLQERQRGPFGNRGEPMDYLQQYRARAAECRAEAEQTTLPNVKERLLRAEQAWSAMAARIERYEESKSGNRSKEEPRTGDCLRHWL